MARCSTAICPSPRTTGFGVTKMTFFGPVHPQFIDIKTDYNTSTQVPWGDVSFPSYEAEFNVGATRDESGVVFHLACTAPRRRYSCEFLVGMNVRQSSGSWSIRSSISSTIVSERIPSIEISAACSLR